MTNLYLVIVLALISSIADAKCPVIVGGYNCVAGQENIPIEFDTPIIKSDVALYIISVVGYGTLSMVVDGKEHSFWVTDYKYIYAGTCSNQGVVTLSLRDSGDPSSKGFYIFSNEPNGKVKLKITYPENKVYDCSLK